MDRSRPIDPDSTDALSAGQADCGESAGPVAPDNGAPGANIPETVADSDGERDDLATERIDNGDQGGRRISPPPEATSALDDDRLTRPIGENGGAESRDVTEQGLCETADLRTIRPGFPPPVISGSGGSCTIGRYRVERRLGKGTFGEVFLAYDSELSRRVAIKIPRSSRIDDPREFEDFVYEARILAGLDHEAIVPVYDVGRMNDGRYYIVSKYVDGCSLDRRLRDDRPGPRIVAGWIASAAEALHFAHALAVIHRDVKPANILLDRAGHLYVADFGLARREQDLEAERGFYGTPAYASPEQARGESHRVDRRSDIFSLGVVLYEALTGTHPFRSSTLQETLKLIQEHAPPPLRAVNAAIPAELERICQKAMAKRIDDRYESAGALAVDLRQWLAQVDAPGGAAGGENSRQRSLVSRGLRPYEDADAETFLELVPGPRGRDGLPECIAFWKRRIEPGGDADPFPVGVIYGPTGSGKSSLVRAGLIPRLGNSVCHLYVESTIEGTEERLLRGLRRRFPELGAHEDAAGLLRELRQVPNNPGPPKLLIVLDQFEQWLFGQRASGRRALEDALRQCDGLRISALLLVRDDFWMDLTRFFRDLEVRLLEGWNAAAVDLFDLDHARKVLTSLGRAHGRLPADPAVLSPEEREFVDRAVSAVAQDGRVVCVRLVLLEQLLRSKPWAPETLVELGEARTIGATILEEAFSSPQAPPQNRVHRRAAQAVLARLLPEGGVLIKGQMWSRQALLEASGYASQPREFQELLWILDHELRLVTPADPLVGGGENDAPPAPERSQYYQLTHDYLIPDLRAWLLEDQKKTLRGRAELRLHEFAAVWSERHNGKFLPSPPEWAALWLMTDRRRWPAEVRAMMRATAARCARGALLIGLLATIVGLAAAWGYAELKARSLVARLKSSDISHVLRIAHDIEPFRLWAVPILKREAALLQPDPEARLRCSLALLQNDPSQIDYLVGRMLALEPVTALTIREALLAHKQAIIPGLWKIASDQGRPARERLQAALALSLYDPPRGPRTDSRPSAWDDIAAPVADELVTMLDANPAAYAALLDAVRPIQGVMIGKLRQLFAQRGDRRLQTATNLLIDLVRDDPSVVCELALEADDHQFLKIYPLLKRHQARILPRLRAAAAPPTAEPGPSDDQTAARRALAAICLLRLGEGEGAWEIFRNEPDPRARTFVIFHGASYGLSPATLIDRLKVDNDPSRIRGLLFAIGQYAAVAGSASESQMVASLVRERFLGHDDAGVHGAAEWLLGKLGANASGGLAAADLAAVSTRKCAPGHWFTTSEGHLMVIIDARNDPRIKRVFAIAARETTIEQMLRFDPGHWYPKEFSPSPACPVGVVTWPRAIEYCEWLNRQERVAESQSCYASGTDRRNYQEIRPDMAKTGYRLPTRAEWEYACRAGTITRRYYGNDENDELLHHYVWLTPKGAHPRLEPVGRLMPNDFGLFDMYGNVSEWNVDFPDSGNHVLTSGGGFKALPQEFDSQYLLVTSPDLEYNQYGFRIARTIELDEKGAPD